MSKELNTILEGIVSSALRGIALNKATGQEYIKAPAPPQKEPSKYVVYIDAGHGGNHPQTGAYMTRPQDGKQYTFLPENINIREGVINRIIADTLFMMLQKEGIEAVKCYHEYLDSSHSQRVNIANSHYQKVKAQGRKAVFLSFHSNAIGMAAAGKSLPARGFSVWTTRGSTQSDKIADMWINAQRDLIGDKQITYRTDTTDGDLDHEANFDVIFFTEMPAVLVENLFFTNLEDAKLLLSPMYQAKSARAAFNVIKNLG